MSDALADMIATETARAIAAPVRAFAEALAARAPGKVAAVLFYGSSLRTGDLDGVLDFYILVDDIGTWRGGVAAFASRALPPLVEYREYAGGNATLRAKVAVMTPTQFAAAIRFDSRDTTIWARFSQPVTIAWVRDDTARRQTVGLVTGAVTTAARWAALLGPLRGKPADYWRALYVATYATELRVEKSARSDEIVAHATARYEQILKPAWQAAGIAFADDAGEVCPRITPQERERAHRAWTVRRLLGKPLNAARLVKAAFTFKGGAAYLAWKTERHTQVALDLTPWQKRHPILVAPGALWRLWRKGVLR